MDESLHAYMRVGILHFMAYPDTIRGEGPIESTIRKIVLDDYFDAVEVSWMKDDGTRGRVARLLEESRMSVAYGAAPRLLTQGLNINDLDEAGRKRALDTLKEGIDEACELGAEGFAFLSGKYEEASLEDSFQALLESTRELCAYAKSRGDLGIVHEIFD